MRNWLFYTLILFVGILGSGSTLAQLVTPSNVSDEPLYEESLLPDPAGSGQYTDTLISDMAKQLDRLNRQSPRCVDVKSKTLRKIYPVVTLPGTPSGDLPVSALTPDELKKIFKELAEDSDIPFGYPDEYCNARAHKMAQLLEEKGIRSVKIFADGHLRAETKNNDKGYVTWNHHVSVAVAVKQPNGKIEMMVIDPALFDKAVPVKTWVNKITDRTRDKNGQVSPKPKVYFTERFNLNSVGAVGSNAADWHNGRWLRSDIASMEVDLGSLRQHQLDRENYMEPPPDADYSNGMGVGLSSDGNE